jgi:protoporphyrinogen oxidase
VLGAGVAGLYAGRVLSRAGANVAILERDTVVGGLAAGREIDGNFYDFGVHHLHAFDQEIFDDIRALMGERLVPVPKVAKVRYGRGYQRYPLAFGDMLRGIPPWTLARCVAGLAAQSLRNRWRSAVAANAEDALIQLYGRPLYEHFFREFTAQYWGFPARELSATFVRKKMPRLSAVDVLTSALEKIGLARRNGAVESALREETLWYSPTGSREMPLALARAVALAGGTVTTGARVTRVDVAAGVVTGVAFRRDGGEEYMAADVCLSTIPLPALVACLHPRPPAEVLRAAGQLRYKPVAVYGLLVRKPQVLDALYIYFRDRTFHRVGEPARSGLRIAPPGHTILLVETTCEVGDPRWRGDDDVVATMIEELAAERLLTPDDVVAHHVFRTAYGYPVFRAGFEAHLDTVQHYLAGIENLRSTGRQGAFCYPNMHVAMRMGATAAEELLAIPAPTRLETPVLA